MKFYLFIFSFIFYNQIFAQVSLSEMRGDFAETAKLGRLQGAESLPTYSSNNINGSRYLLDSWHPGTVVTIKGDTIDSLYIMFDKQNQDLYVKNPKSSRIILVNKNQVNSF